MLELLEKSADVRRFLWAALFCLPLSILLWKLPAILAVLLH